jgi:flagellar basal-body rod protein FlgB
MTDPIANGIADNAIKVALNGLAMRQRAISNNVANVDTPGFKATEVRFEDQLRQIAAKGNARSAMASVSHSSGHLALEVAQASQVQPQVVQDSSLTTRMDGNTVDIEKQMIEMADTVISYNTMIQLATARLSLARYAVNEGRR